MPELPEVETTRRGLQPHLVGSMVRGLEVRQASLRQPVDPQLDPLLRRRRIQALGRRGKYLLLHFTHGCLLSHLGMSGSWRLLAQAREPRRHDHLDLLLSRGRVLRYHDPRRFGLLLWAGSDWQQHALLRHLGPEPLEDGFDGSRLHRRAQGRRAAVKTFLMDRRTVVGVGNIYASEALHLAGIHPARAAGRISLARYQRLATAVRSVLEEALQAGGTTLRDFTAEAGQPGYFGRQLRVYGREGQPCPRCAGLIRRSVLGQRSSFYCASCQK